MTDSCPINVKTTTEPIKRIVHPLKYRHRQSQLRRLHELVGHSRYVEIPESPHNVYYETAAEWNAAVDGFLDEHIQPRAV